jgi:hypothetical protein
LSRNASEEDKPMRQFLAVAGPVAGNFIAWHLISFLPVHPMITFVLVIASGILMLYGIVYFRKIADKNQDSSRIHG